MLNGTTHGLSQLVNEMPAPSSLVYLAVES